MSDPQAAALSVSNLRYRYPGADAPAVRDVSLQFESGSFSALLGPNGSGKSTLLTILAGLARPDEGQVRLGSDDPAQLSRARVAQRVAYLPSRPRVPEDYSVREIVLMGRHPSGRGLLLERESDLQRADDALAKVDASHLAARDCSALSSGERQRVLLARALCQGVGILLLDEPTSAQDLAHELDVFALLAEQARAGCTVVVATHALNAAARHADRLIVLKAGALSASGPPGDVFDAAMLASVFSVEAVLGEDGAIPYAVPRTRSGPS